VRSSRSANAGHEAIVRRTSSISGEDPHLPAREAGDLLQDSTPSTRAPSLDDTWEDEGTRKEEPSMSDDSDEVTEDKKKGGFFRKLMKLAFVAAIVAAAVKVFRRRKGQDLDDVEWQELPPPAGG
jgi:hypothetical protein